MAERVVAVVCSFWPQRRANVEQIVADLRAGTRVPDRIIVLDNGRLFTAGELDGADVVQPTWNTWTRGKFVAGLLDHADWYLFGDDDTSVGRRTVDTLLSWGHHETGVQVTGYWGVRLDPVSGSFMAGHVLSPGGVYRPEPVDAFHGRVMWMSQPAVVRMLALEAVVRAEGRWPHEGDDIIAGLANPGAAYVVPLRGEEAFVDLDQCGEALQFEEGYFASRDAFTRDVLAARAAMR